MYHDVEFRGYSGEYCKAHENNKFHFQVYRKQETYADLPMYTLQLCQGDLFSKKLHAELCSRISSHFSKGG